MAGTYEPISADAAVGSAIMWAREMRGVTRQQLADAMETSMRTLGAVEKGERRLKAGERMAVAHILNVPLSWLEQPPVPETVEVVDTVNAQMGGLVIPLSSLRTSSDGLLGSGRAVCNDDRDCVRPCCMSADTSQVA